jgi:hypothetical protein
MPLAAIGAAAMRRECNGGNMKTFLFALALAAVITVALAEPMALTDLQMAGITAGAGSGNHAANSTGSYRAGGGCSTDGTHCGGGFYHVYERSVFGGTPLLELE